MHTIGFQLKNSNDKKKNQISLLKRMETMHMLYNGTPRPPTSIGLRSTNNKTGFPAYFQRGLDAPVVAVAAREQWQEMSIDAALLHT